MKKKNIILGIFLFLFFIVIFNKIVHIEAAPKSEKAFKVNFFLVDQDRIRKNVTNGAIVPITWETIGVEKNDKIENKVYYSESKQGGNWTEIDLKSKAAKGEEKINVKVPNAGYYYFKIISKKNKETAENIQEMPVYLPRYIFMPGDSELPLVKGVSGRYADDRAEIRWTGTENASYLVGLYNADNMESISKEYTTETSVTLDVPSDIENVSYYVAYVNNNGNNGDFDIYDLPDRNSPNAMVRFPVMQTANTDEMDIDVLFTGNCKVDINVNEREEASGAEASGTYTVPLPEGKVKISVRVTGEEGNIKNYVKELTVDTIKPGVVLDKVIDGAVTTEAEIDVTGECSEDVTLVMNGQKKEIKKGSFIFSQKLSIGENDIKIQAVDAAGNKSNVRAVITRETEHKRSPKATILVGTTFGIIFLAYIITFRGWLVKKRKN